MGAEMEVVVGKRAGQSQGVCPASQEMPEHFPSAR